MIRIPILLWTLSCSVFSLMHAQQVPDTTFTIQFTSPTYTASGPVIGIDGGHNNLHKISSGFQPFARLLQADGYRTVGVTQMHPEDLADLDMLVIANALHSSNLGNWRLPTPSAFTPEEIQQLQQWVQQGGSLLVIADHMPFSGAAQDLAAAFGFSYANGFVTSKQQQWPPEQYFKSNNTLEDHPITAGIDSLAGFTGSALKYPEGAEPIAHFPATHELLLPEVAWQFTEKTPKVPLDEYVLGAVASFGKGKVAFFTEAAMFTAQIVQGQYRVGFNAPQAPQNQQFVRNLIHWLDPKIE